MIAETLLKTAAAWLLIMPVLMMACTPWDKEELDGPGGKRPISRGHSRLESRRPSGVLL